MYRDVEGIVWTSISHTSRSECHSRLRSYSALQRNTARPGLRRVIPRPAKVLFVAPLALLWASIPAPAQEVGLGRTLPNIERTHTVRLGYREASPPFSYLDQAGRPI